MTKTLLRVIQVHSLGANSRRIALTRRISGTTPAKDTNLDFGFGIGSICVEGVAEHHRDLVSLRVTGDVAVLRKGTLLHAR